MLQYAGIGTENETPFAQLRCSLFLKRSVKKMSIFGVDSLTTASGIVIDIHVIMTQILNILTT